MEIRNTPILVRVIRFQSLLGVVYLWYGQPCHGMDEAIDSMMKRRRLLTMLIWHVDWRELLTLY